MFFMEAADYDGNLSYFRNTGFTVEELSKLMQIVQVTSQAFNITGHQIFTTEDFSKPLKITPRSNQ